MFHGPGGRVGKPGPIAALPLSILGLELVSVSCQSDDVLAACDAAWLDIGSVQRVGGADASCVDMTSGDHEFGARFVEKLQMRSERAVRTFNDMCQLVGHHRRSAPGMWRRCKPHG